MIVILWSLSHGSNFKETTDLIIGSGDTITWPFNFWDWSCSIPISLVSQELSNRFKSCTCLVSIYGFETLTAGRKAGAIPDNPWLAVGSTSPYGSVQQLICKCRSFLGTGWTFHIVFRRAAPDFLILSYSIPKYWCSGLTMFNTFVDDRFPHSNHQNSTNPTTINLQPIQH